MSDLLQHKLLRLERILDATTEGWWEWNIEADQTFYGAGWFKMLGLEPIEDAIATSLWEEHMHPEDRIRAIENQQRFIKSDDAWEQEFRMRHVDGRYLWILSRGKVLHRSASGAPLQVGGLHINITAQKEINSLKNELKTKEALVRGILKVSLSSLSMYDFIARRMCFTSGHIMSQMGYPEIEFAHISQDFYKEILHPDDQSKMHEHILKLIQSQQGEHLECMLRFRNKSGDYQTIMFRDSVFERDDEGNPEQVLCSAIDVTKYLMLKAKMDENMKFIREMSFRNSHEMRAPVATMLGLVRLIKFELHSPEAVEELIDYLDKTVTKMDEVIRELTHTLERKMAD